MISILTRAGADAFPSIFDLFSCLAAQTNEGFEWIILARPGFMPRVNEFKIILDADVNLQHRTSLITAETDSRGGLLNIGIEAAKGDYVVVVDDDDLVTSNFVEEFENKRKAFFTNSTVQPYAMRTIPARKIYEIVSTSNREMIGMSPVQFPWPKIFYLNLHLRANQTPCCSIAWPVETIRVNKIKWDENLGAVEDWDFLCNILQHIRVENLDTITSIYRISKNGSRSLTIEGEETWIEAEKIVRGRIAEYVYQVGMHENMETSGLKNFIRSRIEIIVNKAHGAVSNYGFIYRLLRFIYRKSLRRLL